MKLTTENKENTERATPETDDQPTINAINDNGYQIPCVDIEFARKLERERDKAREDLEDWENAAAHVEADHPDEVHCGCVPVLRKLLTDVRKELNEWQTLRLWGGTPEHIHDFIKGQQTRIHEAQDIEKTCEQLERERDEARDLADRYRVAFCSAKGDLVPQVFPWEDDEMSEQSNDTGLGNVAYVVRSVEGATAIARGNITNSKMSEQPTPETDVAEYYIKGEGNFVRSDICRKMERERNEERLQRIERDSSKEEIERLRSHSEMLGMIANHTSSFCINETDTTLVVVLRLLRDYHYAKAEAADLYLDKEEAK